MVKSPYSWVIFHLTWPKEANPQKKEGEREIKSTLSTALDLLFSGIGKISLFTMTVWVAGSTHSVLLPMNVILAKECEESNSPTPRKYTFLLDWNFFEQQ